MTTYLSERGTYHERLLEVLRLATDRWYYGFGVWRENCGDTAASKSSCSLLHAGIILLWNHSSEHALLKEPLSKPVQFPAGRTSLTNAPISARQVCVQMSEIRWLIRSKVMKIAGRGSEVVRPRRPDCQVFQQLDCLLRRQGPLRLHLAPRYMVFHAPKGPIWRGRQRMSSKAP